MFNFLEEFKKNVPINTSMSDALHAFGITFTTFYSLNTIYYYYKYKHKDLNFLDKLTKTILNTNKQSFYDVLFVGSATFLMSVFLPTELKLSIYNFMPISLFVISFMVPREFKK
jgi:hypothetical protein